MERLNTELTATRLQQEEGTVALRAQLCQTNDKVSQLETRLKAAQDHSLGVEGHLEAVSHEFQVASAELHEQKAHMNAAQVSLLNLRDRVDDHVNGSAGIRRYSNEGLTSAFEAHFIALLDNVRGETCAVRAKVDGLCEILLARLGTRAVHRQRVDHVP